MNISTQKTLQRPSQNWSGSKTNMTGGRNIIFCLKLVQNAYIDDVDAKENREVRLTTFSRNKNCLIIICFD